ncbi:helix-turn-helix domain-containing protein [Streptosporangiaceae bacterium NEAU-GS5]|nr:helix-turn-helix domain-containing protein [Streptosporangiaceae bacterium NEAU-GS5]
MSRSVLETGVRVLRAVPAHGGSGQIAAIARALDIPYPTVHRTLVRLHRLGLVAKTDAGYVLGYGIAELADRMEPYEGLRAAAAPVMTSIRDRTGRTISLVVHLDGAAFVLDSVPGADWAAVPRHTVCPSALSQELFASGDVSFAGDVPASGPHSSVYTVRIPLPDGARAALHINSRPEQPASRFAALLDEGARRIGLAVRRQAPGRAAR